MMKNMDYFNVSEKPFRLHVNIGNIIQSATFDQRSGVFIMHKECDAACSRDLDHDSSYTELPGA